MSSGKPTREASASDKPVQPKNDEHGKYISSAYLEKRAIRAEPSCRDSTANCIARPSAVRESSRASSSSSKSQPRRGRAAQNGSRAQQSLSLNASNRLEPRGRDASARLSATCLLCFSPCHGELFATRRRSRLGGHRAPCSSRSAPTHSQTRDDELTSS